MKEKIPSAINNFRGTFHFWSSKNVNKGIEIMDLSWVLCTTKTIPLPSIGDGNDGIVCDVTDGSQPFYFQKAYWSFMKEMIAKQEDQIRPKTKTMKENNRLINLLACKAYLEKEATCKIHFFLYT